MQFIAELLAGKIDAVSSSAMSRVRPSMNDLRENQSYAKLSIFILQNRQITETHFT
jgi:hypothetical protein